MNGASFNINKSVSSLVARLSRRFGEITISGCDLGATALDIIETAKSVTYLEQIKTVRWLGRDGCLSAALEATQRVARLHSQ